jgi:hypothetical protein
MHSAIGLLDVDHDGEADYRIWRRVFEKDAELLYVAAVRPFRAALGGEERAYLALTFPWPLFALAVVLECRNAGDPRGGAPELSMSTRGRGASLAGTYAVVPGDPGRVSFARLPGLHEHFRFGVRRGAIEGTHSAYVGGARVFTLGYEIHEAKHEFDRPHSAGRITLPDQLPSFP